MPYKILVIPSIHIYPNSSGGSHALLSFLQKQQYTHEISLALAPNNISKEDIDAFQQLLPHVNLIPIGFKKKHNAVIRFIHKLKRKSSSHNIFRKLWKTPFLSNLIIKNETFITEIALLLQKQSFDLVQVEFSQNMGLSYVIPQGIKKVFVHHELVHPRVAADMMALKYDKYYATYISNIVESIELHCLQQYDGIITLSPDDKALLEKKGITKPIDVAPSFALLKDELEKIYDPKAPQHLLFMGSGDHFPNEEGLTWFLDEVMPLVVKVVSEAKLLITGNWSESFKSKYQTANVQFTGFIDDLNPVLKQSISISPIRIGSGIRIKIITSMAKGVPVVSTTLGASGIAGLVHEHNIMIADEGELFAKYCIQLLNDPTIRKTLSERCYELSYDNYTNIDYAEQRSRFYDQIIGKNN